jgi:outer membrane protein OmpA-like peptidoglycan-associated protein
MLSNYFLPTESQRPQITAFKWFGKRFDVLLFADDEVAQLLAERGQIGCNRLNNFSEECRDQIVPLLNAFRKELGLSQLSPAVVKDALSFPDTMADIYGPTRSAATAEPPPPPSIPSLPSFMLFFDHDQSHLSPQAINTVKQAADAFKTHPGLVLVSGNTDTSEATELSLRRANEVKDVLVANGVPPTAIAVIARGATFLLVPTANHIREPQNRRVLITLRPDK